MMNPFKTKKGLGRGLSSLIGDSNIKFNNNKISISSIIPNKYQDTPLHNAAHKGYLGLAKLLLQFGANKDLKNNGFILTLSDNFSWYMCYPNC